VQYLASFRGEDSVIAVEPYDIEALKKAFADADANGWFIEAMFLEPVMGEGDPGRSVPVAFYNAARELTKAHGSLLLVDSIQAGSGAVFSLLPPENATGNFVKVVQRVPVKLVFEPGENGQHLLVPGMSVVPIISLR